MALFDTSASDKKVWLHKTGAGKAELRNARNLASIRKMIPKLDQGTNYFFVSDGAWSEDNILEHILTLTGGHADVTLFTWSFGQKAASRIINFKRQGRIKSIRLLTHPFIERNFSVLQTLRSEMEIATTKIHAKGFIVRNERWKVSCTSSSNYTDNQTLECGVISTLPEVYEFHSEWLGTFFKGGGQ